MTESENQRWATEVESFARAAESRIRDAELSGGPILAATALLNELRIAWRATFEARSYAEAFATVELPWYSWEEELHGRADV